MTYSWKESYDMCQLGVCKYYTYDMDGAFCIHPKSFEISPIFDCSMNRMISEGLCTGCSSDSSKNLRQLFEPLIKN